MQAYDNYLYKFLRTYPLAALVGTLDSSNYVMYILKIEELPFYVFLLCAKIILLVFGRANIRLVAGAVPFCVAVAVAVVFSSMANSVEMLSIAKAFGVLASILISVAFVGGFGVGAYTTAIALNGLVIATFYLVSFKLGLIEDYYGRYLFFGGAHFNLGCELLAVIVVASTFCLELEDFFVLFALSFGCAWLMQGRSAELVMLISAAVYTTLSLSERIGVLGALGFGLFVAFVTVITGLLGLIVGSDLFYHFIDSFANGIFMADDENRGLGTGFTGRDEHWGAAIQIFTEYPFVGAGLDFPERLKVLQPHNWFLYGLAQFGLLGIPIFVSLASAFVLVAKADRKSALKLTPLLILLALNDRFLNFNAYPLVMYILVFSLSPVALGESERSRRVVGGLRDVEQPRYEGSGGRDDRIYD
jgi:hypothetical protein